MADWESEARKLSFEAAMAYARGALQALFLANGVAAISLLTTMGALLGDDDLKYTAGRLIGACVVFSYGVAAAVVAACLAYIIQTMFTELAIERHRLVKLGRLLAIAAGTVSLGCFVFGIMRAAEGFNFFWFGTFDYQPWPGSFGGDAPAADPDVQLKSVPTDPGTD